MRLLGLDLGERRIGLAVSGGPGLPALPAGYLDRDKLARDIERVLEIARERQIEGFVVGIPYTLSGDVGIQARRAQGFVRALRRRAALPVYTVDERFTSVEAEGLMREAAREPSRSKGQVDSVAASLILSRYLEQSGEAPAYEPPAYEPPA